MLGELQACNQRGTLFTGYTEKELIGKRWPDGDATHAVTVQWRPDRPSISRVNSIRAGRR